MTKRERQIRKGQLACAKGLEEMAREIRKGRLFVGRIDATNEVPGGGTLGEFAWTSRSTLTLELMRRKR